MLAVRHSYKPGLRLPKGGIGKSENHRNAAVRELREEVGVAIDPSQLRLVFAAKSRLGLVHFYEARLAAMPVLRIDRREVVEAVFLPPGSLFEPSRRIAAYLVNKLHERSQTMNAGGRS